MDSYFDKVKCLNKIHQRLIKRMGDAIAQFELYLDKKICLRLLTKTIY